MDNFHQLSQEFCQKMFIGMVGNFLILVFNAVISSLVRVAKSVLSQTIMLEIFVYLVITI